MSEKEPNEDLDIELHDVRADDRSAGDLRILISERAYRDIETHANEDMKRELGGVIVGEVFETDSGTVLLLEDAIRALHADRQHTSVKFTHDTWAHINSVKDARFPDKRILAWYHSHPNFGIFLSDFDKFIQNNFFNLPWQVAYVVDPVRHERGFFKWKDGEIVEADGLGVYAESIEALQPAEEPEPFEEPPPAPLPPPSRAPLAVGIATGVLVALVLVLTIAFRPQPPPDRGEEAAALKQAVSNLEQNTSALQNDVARLQAIVDSLPPEPESVWIKGQSYTVKPGDTLWSVSKRFYGDANKWNIIRVVNGLGGRTRLAEGEVLLIPALPAPQGQAPSQVPAADEGDPPA